MLPLPIGACAIMIGQQIINGLMLGSVYAMVAVALTLSIGVLNFLNFSIPGLFMIGGMTFWALMQAGVPWPLAVLGALGVAHCCVALADVAAGRC